MSPFLKIGELPSLGAMPYFFPLKHLFHEPNWQFMPGSPLELEHSLARGELDIALVSPLVLCEAPNDYLILPGLGYSARRHVKDMLLFSDILLDDMDEMSVSLQDGAVITSAMIQVILTKYLQYQINFINGWGGAESFVLEGDPALRERMLARYTYVYDMGDLWSHYTREPMIYYLWVVRRSALREKHAQLVLFHRLLRQAYEVSRSDWSRLAALVRGGYEWLRKPSMIQLWTNLEYEIEEPSFDGLKRFFEDAYEVSVVDEVPDLEFFEPEWNFS